MKTITAFAPATVANLGCGFDIMGLAIKGEGDIVSVQLAEDMQHPEYKEDNLSIVNRSGVDLPSSIDNNVITPAVRAFMDSLRIKMESPSSYYDIEVDILKKIYPGSGVGSSAASSSAAVYALNNIFNSPFSEPELVYFAMQGEKLLGGVAHADNVAPAIMGGVTLIRGYSPLDIVRLPIPEDFYSAVVHPHLTVLTSEARKVLPEDVSLRKSVNQWGNVGGLVAGFYTSDMELIARSMKDEIVEQYRKGFIPGYDELRVAAEKSGAMAMNIAGSGPSVFAVCNNAESAEKVGKVMHKHFIDRKIDCDIFVNTISQSGAKIIE